MNTESTTSSGGVAANQAKVPLECDVVMKGGITSGVIYPRLISTLSRVYKLRSFGGTSVGAIAAAAGAAAQLGRVTGANPDSFTTLDKLPKELGDVAVGATDSMLFRLFQPQKALARPFAVLKAALNAKSAVGRVKAIALKLLVEFPVAALIGAVPGLVVFAYAVSLGAVFGVVFAAVGALVGAVVGAVLCLSRELPKNEFGLCDGMPGIAGKGPAQESLTLWLHHYLNGLAGKTGEEPLTFGELWTGKLRSGGEEWRSPGSTDPRVVDLAMITTGLNLGRPFRLPFETQEIYFTRGDMEKLFPASVVSWLVEHARPSDTAKGLSKERLQFYALPVPADFPVIVAVRLSLSFPILLSAVPFYIVDRTLSKNHGKATVATKVFFSDGGICSNFPIQFFDAALPTRPTFGVDLRAFHPEHMNERVWMPASGDNRGGIETYCPPLSTAAGVGSIAGFVGAIVSTMQNWQDQMQLILPGFRDRIIHVSHSDQEGGLNLNMPPGTITTLANSGADAARDLITGFAEGGGLGTPNAWDNHQRIRVRTLLCLVQHQLESIAKGLDRQRDPTWAEIVANPAPRSSYAFQPKELATTANDLLAELERLAKSFPSATYPLCAGAPKPSPELKVAPRM